jgi:YD repeat-containing protein
MIQTSGWFGYGWATTYDEYLTSINNYTVRIALADGRAVYFGRTDIAAPFSSLTPDFYGQLIKNPDNTYTLTFKDGRVHQFNAGGRLLWQKDRNGNQTNLTYDGGGNLSGINDAFGRTLTVTTNLVSSHKSAIQSGW